MYHNKYLKYKNKYNYLKKKLLGGMNTVVKSQPQFLSIAFMQGFITDKVIITKDTDLSNFTNDQVDSRIYIVNDNDLQTLENLNKSSLIFKNLQFCDGFNLSIDTLTDDKVSTIEKIIFGFYFNNQINKKFPKLKELKFGFAFNQSLDSLDVPELQKLVLGNSFNKSILNNFPNLKELIFGDAFNKSLDDLNAPELENLQIGSQFKFEIPPKFKKLKELTVSLNFKKSLKSLNKDLKINTPRQIYENLNSWENQFISDDVNSDWESND
jgi:hypothetical protein